jgi:hypothetical protein
MSNTTTSRQSITYKSILTFLVGVFSGASGTILICLAVAAFLSGCSTLPLPMTRNNSSGIDSCVWLPLPFDWSIDYYADLRVCQKSSIEVGEVTSDD